MAAADPPAQAGDGFAVRTEGLGKRYGAQDAVHDLDLVVPAGAVYGFLGPNGSGKTTTIRMLLGLISPTTGRHELLGHPMPDGLLAALPRVGSLVEGPAFHPHLSGRANLTRLDAADQHADPATRHTRIGEALERVGLTAAAGKRFRAYSLGMKQRLAIAAALLAPRDLLVLDEPTNGLDPQGTREIRHLVGALAQEGVTVLISSHLLSEVEQVCTHVGVMRAGTLVAQDSIEGLRARQRAELVLTTPDPDRARVVLQRAGVRELAASADGLTGTPGEQPAERIVEALVADGVRVRGIELRTPKLEELYVQLTGEGFDVRG
ncbi:ATP-binding cassette domain-containing protein [Calidifontibacter sp. DB0510]|uniref:ATP-binding cassette domain-containing protein n=1 Tax=Metallococcus carri TaxID=1656884 RepID=A0A967B4J1_9MICO|nr:ATP-binding cassette domain-containing protein [Metallococcus carri]NHN57145.1 ATP-binding cassette domain-containing protein [Metallococcus carri]NOP38052.1 ATP-binding cassette domain-containing protein [Calidifontibacter sp. DB2511S]